MALHLDIFYLYTHREKKTNLNYRKFFLQCIPSNFISLHLHPLLSPASLNLLSSALLNFLCSPFICWDVFLGTLIFLSGSPTQEKGLEICVLD